MSDLVNALLNVTTEDLEELDRQIEDMAKSLEAARSARRIIRMRLNGRDKAPPKQPIIAEVIYELLSEQGPQPLATICEHVGKTKQQVTSPIKVSGWFIRHQDDTVEIAINEPKKEEL